MLWLLPKRKGALVAIGLNAIDVASNEVAAPSGTGIVSNGTYDGDFAVNDISANIVSGGRGSMWCDVYNVLQPKNLIAVGGRGAGLGVGGLTISLRSPCFTVFQNVRAEQLHRWHLVLLALEKLCVR